MDAGLVPSAAAEGVTRASERDRDRRGAWGTHGNILARGRLRGVDGRGARTAGSITVFAPDNHAFAKLTAHDMTMMSGTAELARILKHHVVSGRVTPAELSGGMTLKTLEGGEPMDRCRGIRWRAMSGSARHRHPDR